MDNREKLISQINKLDAVIVYGAGNMGKAAIKWCQEQFDNKAIYVAITEKKACDDSVLGIQIHEIKELTELCKNAMVIVATFSGYFDEIGATLQNYEFEYIAYMEEWFVEECFYGEYWKLPIVPNKILVENFHGLGYGDSPKYVVNELLRRNCNLDIVWVVKKGTNSNNFPTGIRTVEMHSQEFYQEVATSAIWLSNVRKYQSVRKREEQFYIQTWHGFPMKTIEKDAEECSNGISQLYFDAGKRDSKMINILTSNAEYLTQIFRRTFWYEGEIVNIGSPRNDIFFKNTRSLIEKVKKHYNIDTNKKIILYAPTFRNNYTKDPYDLDVNQVLVSLEKRFGGEYVCLFRLHPNIAKKSVKYEFNSRIINASYYEDMMELLAASDILISDYSSSVFDYMLTYKAVFLYANDIERYTQNDRGFYFDYKSLPFPIAETNQEMVSKILDFDNEKYKTGLQEFIYNHGFCDDGNASARVAELILRKMEEKNESINISSGIRK